jgi:hypothetical protein
MTKITSVSVLYLVVLPSVPLVTFKVADLHCRWDGAMNGIFWSAVGATAYRGYRSSKRGPVFPTYTKVWFCKAREIKQNISNAFTWFRCFEVLAEDQSLNLMSKPCPCKWLNGYIRVLVFWSVTLCNWFTLITLHCNTTQHNPAQQISIWLHAAVNRTRHWCPCNHLKKVYF